MTSITRMIFILVCIVTICVACTATEVETPGPTSELPTLTPELATSIPEPATPTPEPATPTPEPPTPTPEPPTPTPVPDLLGLIQAYQEAHNGHDSEASADFFAPNAKLSMGTTTLEGQDQIRAFHEYIGMLNAELQLNTCFLDGQTVTCEALVSNDFDEAMGFKQLNYPVISFRFEGGLIQEVVGELHPARAPVVEYLSSSFQEWLAENRPDEYTQLYGQEGRTIYSLENAERIVPLVGEWREATEQSIREALVGIWTVEGAGGYWIFDGDGKVLRTTSLEDPWKYDLFQGVNWVEENWSLQGPILNLNVIRSSLLGGCPGSLVGRYAVEIVPGVSLEINEIFDSCNYRRGEYIRDWIWHST